jgi:hypothetical protein
VCNLHETVKSSVVQTTWFYRLKNDNCPLEFNCKIHSSEEQHRIRDHLARWLGILVGKRPVQRMSNTFLKMLAQYISDRWLVRFVYLYSCDVVSVHEPKWTCSSWHDFTLLWCLSVECLDQRRNYQNTMFCVVVKSHCFENNTPHEEHV